MHAANRVGATIQLACCLATANQPIVVLDHNKQRLSHWLQQLPKDVAAFVIQASSVEQAVKQQTPGAALFEGDGDELLVVAQQLAEHSAVIIQPQGRTVAELEEGKSYRLERLLVERSLSVNTAAAGGNATLMAMI